MSEAELVDALLAFAGKVAEAAHREGLSEHVRPAFLELAASLRGLRLAFLAAVVERMCDAKI